jgi:hypothetical protein
MPIKSSLNALCQRGEMVDAVDSKSTDFQVFGVQVPALAPPTLSIFPDVFCDFPSLDFLNASKVWYTLLVTSGHFVDLGVTHD